MKIAIAGEFRRGKDTVANIIQSELLADKPVRRLAFADALKTELAAMTYDYIVGERGTFEAWNAHMRRLRAINGVGWQWWGEFRRQTEGENYWVNHPLFRLPYEVAVQCDQHIIITDMRHDNEAAWCKRNGFYLIRVEGPCRAPEDMRYRSHPSEIHIEFLDVHDVIKNNGTLEQLKQRVPELIRSGYAAFVGGA